MLVVLSREMGSFLGFVSVWDPMGMEPPRFQSGIRETLPVSKRISCKILFCFVSHLHY